MIDPCRQDSLCPLIDEHRLAESDTKPITVTVQLPSSLDPQDKSNPVGHQNSGTVAVAHSPEYHLDFCNRAGTPERTFKKYPTVIIRSTGCLIVKMFATPSTDGEASWPDIDDVRLVRSVHQAFTVTLHIASDELCFDMELGPAMCSYKFSHKQRACFVLGGRKMLRAAMTRGFGPVQTVVSLLPAFAHMVRECIDVHAKEEGKGKAKGKGLG